MLKKLIITIICIFSFPLSVYAKNNVNIVCDKEELYNTEEAQCKIIADSLDYVVTSISGQVKVGNNLSITSSSYDDSKWMMLDSKFNVKDINLISEDKKHKDNFIIATFKLKATNKKNSVDTISFENVMFGDEDYQDREQKVESISLNLKYNEKLDIKNKFGFNKFSSFIILFIVFIALFIYIKKRKFRSRR